MAAPTPSPTDTFTINPGLPADAPAIESAEESAGGKSIFGTLLDSPALPGSPPPPYPPPRPRPQTPTARPSGARTVRRASC
jgi:hypothetical protein